MTDPKTRLSQWQLAPFHIGAAIGPMTGGVIAVVFTVLLDVFAVDRATLSLVLPAYMFPYAIVQLVSGSISDLTSRRLAILLGFGSYGLATLLTGLAPSFAVFLAGQVLQGATNAFTTPILMATLGDVVPGHRTGRTMGIFSSANLAGAMVGPLLAGFLAEWTWRSVYILVAALSWALMLWYAVWFRRFGAAVPRRRRSSHLRQDLAAIARAAGLPVLLLAGLSFFANAAMRGPAYLFAEYLRDLWGIGLGQAGLILSLYGLAGMLTGPFAGYVVDRVGVYRAIAAGAIGVALSLAIMGVVPSPSLFALGNFLLGVTGIVAWAGLNTLAVRLVPEHRGTAASIFGSARFFAQGTAPLWFTPLYQYPGPRSIFAVAAILALALLAPLLGLRRKATGRLGTLEREAVVR